MPSAKASLRGSKTLNYGARLTLNQLGLEMNGFAALKMKYHCEPVTQLLEGAGLKYAKDGPAQLFALLHDEAWSPQDDITIRFHINSNWPSVDWGEVTHEEILVAAACDVTDSRLEFILVDSEESVEGPVVKTHAQFLDWYNEHKAELPDHETHAQAILNIQQIKIDIKRRTTESLDSDDTTLGSDDTPLSSGYVSESSRDN